MARLTLAVARHWRRYEPRGLLSPLVVPPLFVAGLLALGGIETSQECTPSDPCPGAVGGFALVVAWLAAFLVVVAAPRVAAVCAAAGAFAMAMAVDAPALPRAVASVAATWTGGVAVHGLRRRRAQRAYVASVAEVVPSPLDRRLERRARLLAGAAVLTFATAVAATVVTVRVVARERERERAAPVADALVVRHEEDDYVVFSVEDRESAWEAHDAGDFPVGAVVPVYVLDTGARPVAEPYDADYASFPAMVAWVAALVMAERALVAQRWLRRAEVPALEAKAREYFGAAVVTGGGLDVMVVHDRAGEEPEEVVVAGDLVPGGWAALLRDGRVAASGRVYGAGRMRDAVREVLWRR